MPKSTTFKGVMENAHGKPLKDYGINDESGKLISALSYSATFEELVKGDEIPAKEQPDADDILALVNNKRKANARQKETQDLLTKYGFKRPEIGVDMEHTFNEMVKILVKTGKDEATAKQMANANLGTNY